MDPAMGAMLISGAATQWLRQFKRVSEWVTLPLQIAIGAGFHLVHNHGSIDLATLPLWISAATGAAQVVSAGANMGLSPLPRTNSK